MLTRRKKLNILYLCIGIVIGAAIAAVVTYYSVIANFTKERIVKIQNIFPVGADTTKTIAIHADYPKGKQTKKQPKNQAVDSIQTTKNDIPDTEMTIVDREIALPAEAGFVIKSDVKVSDAIVPVKYITEDSTQNLSLRKGEMIVELWENPTNFAGYRKSQNKLIVYGIDIDDIDFHSINDSLFMIYNNKKLFLKDSDTFVHYPAGFIK
jgi:hypothetical protein